METKLSTIYTDQKLGSATGMAVLFLVFNRPETTSKVFRAIQDARPSRLYIASDGPRPDKIGETEIVYSVRDDLLKAIDWDCEVATLFRDGNLGCKNAVNGAIDWFFEHEEEGIILEDDCLPSPDFFHYCKVLLDRYRFDSRVAQICGCNMALVSDDFEYPYFFSKHGFIWGWATWRRAWIKNDFTMENYQQFKSSDVLSDIISRVPERRARYREFDAVKNNEINTWDYQWSYSRYLESMYSIVPKYNLIRNIGFGESATHTKTDDKRLSDLPLGNFSDSALPFFVRNVRFDYRYSRIKAPNLTAKLLQKVGL